MNKTNLLFWAIACLFFFSCKKDVATTAPSGSEETPGLPETLEASWQGVFVSYNGTPPTRFFTDDSFIKNGYARVYNDSVAIDKNNYYGTVIRLSIPASVRIKGDSLNFEAGVKNPAKSAFYNPYYGRDVALYIKGETNEALINHVVTSDVNPNVHNRAEIKLGQTVTKDIAGLQHNFEEYDTVTLQTFNRGVVAYRNNQYLNGLNYGSEPLIGKLTEIGIAFKGSGYVDYVKLYNSNTGKLLMQEDFNTDGKSTIIWY